MTGRFVALQETVEVAVITVTYNSAAHIDELIRSVRREAAEQRVRFIVVDNGSSDSTRDLVRRHGDVILVESGGNLGYSGGINVAVRFASDAGFLLVLNPDIWVQPGCIGTLRDRAARSGAGLVVPRIQDPNGAIYPSLRREPSLIRAMADAALGNRFATRPAAFSEIVGGSVPYEHPHRIDWATGAAILISSAVARQVGEWDERFFMYSEETDFFRRARDLGTDVWYEPLAVVHHAQGGSGSSAQLDSLLTVNRIRYFRKHHGRLAAGIYRGIVIIHELARSYQPPHRVALRYAISEETWSSLPQARSAPPTGDRRAASGSVIIPAHNEAAVIGRTLRELADLPTHPDLDVIVAVNGCFDGTADLARNVPGVVVLELPEASKTAALNAAEASTDRFPRIYLDADIVITPKAINDTLDVLREAEVLAARPPYRWDLGASSWLVRRYYGARQRIPSVHKSLWGAGVYGLSAQGRARFDRFPPITADDLFVDLQFTADERQIVATDPVRLRAPRTTRSLLAVLRRQARGSRESKASTSYSTSTSSSTLRELMSSVRGPKSLVEAGVYVALSVLSRVQTSRAHSWERDESTRDHTSEHEDAQP